MMPGRRCKNKQAAEVRCVAIPSSEQQSERLQELKQIFQDYVQKTSSQPGKSNQRTSDREWFTQHAESLFPGIGTKAWSVPAYFTSSHYQQGLDSEVCNKPLTNKEVLDQAVKFQQTVKKNDIKGDCAQRLVGRVVRNFNADLERRKEETMFIISQVHFDNVLAVLRRIPEGFATSPETSSAKRKTPKKKCKLRTKPQQFVPVDLDKKLKNRGELDLMILHREKGVVLIQIKGAGDKHTGTDKDDQHEDTEDEMKACMEKARKQLKRDAEIFTMVMNHSKLKGCQVTKVMGLPHLRREVVKKMTEKNRDYDGITFLCEEDLFGGDISVSESETNLEPFRAWLGKIPPQVNKMELDLMKEIVGRYVGLLSTVVTFKSGTEMALLRTFKDSVHHTSCLNERMVLSQAQVKVMGEYGKHQRSYISGPPGSGKTLLLVLGSRTFLAESKRRHVIVVNMYRGAKGRAIGNTVYEGINAGHFFQGRVHCLPVDVDELTSEKFAEEVNTKCPGVDERDLLFVVDEIYIEHFWRCILDSFEEAFTSSRVLCAGLFSRTPKGFHEHCLDIVHRCPPSVQSLLYQVDWSEDRKRAYVMDYGHRRETSTNGPTPLCVRHEKHDQGVAVSKCPQCALELFDILREEGLVSTGVDDGGGACAAPETSLCATKNFKVMILVNIPRNRYHNNEQYIETTDMEYQKYMDYISTCPFIVTLREKGLNVEMKAELGCKDLNDVTKGCLSATWVFNFQGLETGVIIFLPGDNFGDKPSHECPLAEEEISLLSQLSTEDDSTKKGVPQTEKATGAQKPFVSRREIPAPGLKVVKVVERARDKEQKSQTQSATSGVSSEQGLSKPKERKELEAAAKESGITYLAGSVAPPSPERGAAKSENADKSSKVEIGPTKVFLQKETVAKVADVSSREIPRQVERVDLGQADPPPGDLNTEGRLQDAEGEDDVSPTPHQRVIPAKDSSRASRRHSAREIPGHTSSSSSQNSATETTERIERREEDRRPYISHSDLYWTRPDIDRFSAWDQTNIMVAGSRCLSLFILIVP